MKNILTKVILATFLILGLGTAIDMVAPVTDNIALAGCTVDASSNEPINPDCNDDIKTLNDKIYMFAYVIGGLVLGVGVFMIVYAGFKYATSQGDPKQTETAKMQIIAAGIGIFIVMLAFIILRVFTGAVGLG